MRSCKEAIANYQPIGTFKPDYPQATSIHFEQFIEEIPKSLREAEAIVPEFTYSFKIPYHRPYLILDALKYTEKRINQLLNISESTLLSTLDEKHQGLVRKAMDSWENIANIRFVENNHTDALHIFQFNLDSPTDEMLHLMRCTDENRQSFIKGYTDMPHLLTFNGDFLNLCDLLHSPRAYKTVIHELGHVLGLNHLFEVQQTTPYSRSTSYSIMNYAVEFENDIPIYALTPMLADILAVQYRFGSNQKTNVGHTIYNLKDLFERYAPYKSIASFWDADGIDTLDASALGAREISINLRPFARSNLGIGYLVLPDISIENIITSRFNNTIVLNALDNRVDLTKSTFTTLIIDPQNCGHDTIIGFNPDTSKIILERAPLNHPSTWTLKTTGCDIISKRASLSIQNCIIFDEDNAVLFSDPIQLRMNNFLSNEHNEVIQCQLIHENADNVPGFAGYIQSLEAIFCHFPETFYHDFTRAVVKGLVISFLFDLTKEQLKKYDFSDANISIFLLLTHALMALVAGSAYSSATFLITSYTLNCLGFNEKTSFIVSRCLAELIEPCNLIRFPAKVCCEVVAQTSAAALSQFGLWTKGYLYDRFFKKTKPEPEAAAKHLSFS